MMVTFVSQCEKKALNRTRRVLDSFANRIGDNTWQTVITNEGLSAVKKLLRKTASKNTAVSCFWIRSRSRSQFLWVVGNRNKFNNEGVVPVNYTEKDILKNYYENDWRYLPLIQALTVFAALLHDFGKASVLFQEKLIDNNICKGDPLRHEWVSVLFLVAIVDGKSDKEWLSNLMNSNNIHTMIAKLKINNVNNKNPLENLPPLASMIAWLILTHHKMPTIEKYSDQSINLNELLSLIDETWGYRTCSDEDYDKMLGKCFEYKELPSQSIEWQAEIKKYASRLHINLALFEKIFSSDGLRLIMLYSRLSLMLADHYYSSQAKDKNWHSALKLFANTDKNGLKQQLDEHLVNVAKQAKLNVRGLPNFEGVFNRYIRVENKKELQEKSHGDFKWQDKAVANIEKWRKDTQDLDKHQFGFFAVNMASTGKGKTLANAKIMQALSPDENSLRYILALGLRTLTLQTGTEYRKKAGLKDDELAVLIGSRAISLLYKDSQDSSSKKEESGSESSESLGDEELIFTGSFDEFGLDTVLRYKQHKQFLHAPVLACTIDHIIQTTETTRGGRYILPTLRLMSSDLVIDEIDDFDNEDLIAIGRLIHLAGMLGRKVMISSATIPPDLAQGYFNVYQSGWLIFSKMRNKKQAVGCGWIDEFNTKIESIDTKENYQKQHKKFIKKRIDNLDKAPIKRKVNIVQCSTDLDDYYPTIRQEIINKHQHHHFKDSKTGKTISIGVVRMANVKPCILLTMDLLDNHLSADVEVKTMAYHSRQVLLMRHEQEKYLDKILKRNKGDEHILKDKTIRKHIDSSISNHIAFVLVATPVEEVGRDHDFDWAIIEPSSYRSFIQLAGRVLRHRNQVITQPNIGILQYNYKTLQIVKLKGEDGLKKCPVFKNPGYQNNASDLEKYNLDKLVNVDELAKKLDASNRIQKPKRLNPSTNLADLEHKVIAELLTNYNQTGASTMQGWLAEAWWLSGIHQEYIKFRKSNPDEIQFLIPDVGFSEKSKTGKPVPQNNIAEYDLSQKELMNLWFERDWGALLTAQAKGEDLEKTALIYGEITLPSYGKPLTEKQFSYNEQLGLTDNTL